jgi:hypothetical protein
MTRTVVKATHPRLELLGDWHTFRLLESWCYEWVGPDGRRRLLRAPAGTRTDLASVPKLLHWWIGPPDLRRSSIPHDLLYFFAGRIPPTYFLLDGEPCYQQWTRKAADKLFARIMRDDGVSRVKRRAAYLGVRLGGGFVWDRARRQRPARIDEHHRQVRALAAADTPIKLDMTSRTGGGTP